MSKKHLRSDLRSITKIMYYCQNPGCYKPVSRKAKACIHCGAEIDWDKTLDFVIDNKIKLAETRPAFPMNFKLKTF